MIEVYHDCFMLESPHILPKSPSLEITDCPSLTTLTIGAGSFQRYSSFTLKNVNSLTSLKIGEGDYSANFFLCKKLILADMPNLTRIYLAGKAFYHAITVKFKSNYFSISISITIFISLYRYASINLSFFW